MHETSQYHVQVRWPREHPILNAPRSLGGEQTEAQEEAVSPGSDTHNKWPEPGTAPHLSWAQPLWGNPPSNPRELTVCGTQGALKCQDTPWVLSDGKAQWEGNCHPGPKQGTGLQGRR